MTFGDHGNLGGQGQPGSSNPGHGGFGQAGYGAPGGQGQPQYGQPQYGQPQYGQPNHGHQQPNAGQQPYGQPGPFGSPAAPAPASGSGSVASRLTATRSGRPTPTLIIGAGLAVLGLVMVAFSFLTWATAELQLNQSIPGAGAITGSVSSSVTGLGSVSTSNDIDVSSLPSQFQEQFKQELEREQSSGDSSDDNTAAPGVWTIVFGVLLVIASVPLILRRFPAIASIVGTVIGLAALIAAAIFLSDPGAAVSADGKSPADDNSLGGPAPDVHAGYGLWIVFVAALVALIVAVGGLVLSLMRPATPAGPAPTAFGNGFPGAPQPGFGSAPGQQGLGQPGFGQQGFGQQQYPGQSGFRSAPGRQEPGQQGFGGPPRSGW
ncbi:hypothetical protein [Gordonia polyisoprenivorans]|uniref:hypothetical protein n=1 Tax=Gordonia polyisoprenivorans TaxID=84595 RepID=UPI001FCCB08D|nr:hypothetical protein [Gordonia polyisoprenivorans]